MLRISPRWQACIEVGRNDLVEREVYTQSKKECSSQILVGGGVESGAKMLSASRKL
jgi:hypothetical protein